MKYIVKDLEEKKMRVLNAVLGSNEPILVKKIMQKTGLIDRDIRHCRDAIIEDISIPYGITYGNNGYEITTTKNLAQAIRQLDSRIEALIRQKLALKLKASNGDIKETVERKVV